MTSWQFATTSSALITRRAASTQARCIHASAHVYETPEELDYAYRDSTVRAIHCGQICIHGRKITSSDVFASQLVGIREVDDQAWQVSLTKYDLGFFDKE